MEHDELSTQYKIGLPAPDDTPDDIAARERMWKNIQQKIRQQETWMQWAKRIVKGWMR